MYEHTTKSVVEKELKFDLKTIFYPLTHKAQVSFIINRNNVCTYLIHT
jgi:hypothetical protein